MGAIEVLARKYRDLFEFAEVTLAQGPKTIAGQKANTLAKHVTLFHFVRAGYLLEAIYLLCSHGLATEGMVILRSFLNLYINLKWLTSSDIDQRFQRFADFEVVFKKLAMQTLIDHGDIWDKIKNENLAIHDQDFEFIKEKYNLTKREDFFNWSGLSIFKMASEKGVDLEKEYRVIYGQLSSIEHTCPESVRRYLDRSEKGITIKAGPRDENIDLVLITALEYYLHVKAITHTLFDVEWIIPEKDKEAFLKIRKKYWGEEKV